MSEEVYDIAIVGCGPAGLSAAICAKGRNKSVLLLGSTYCTRKLDQAPVVENYLGMPKVSGKDLRNRYLSHVSEFGLQVLDARITSIYPGDGTFSLFSAQNGYTAKTVILAMGVSRSATLPGEDQFIGRGVSYCATCDGPLYKGKTVAVVSGIAEGEEEATYLAEIAAKVYYLPQYKGVGKLPDNVEIIVAKPKGIEGNEKAERLTLPDGNLDVDCIFMIYDAAPAEQIVQGLEMDEGHVRVDRLMKTNINGIFAAGDCAGKPYQIAKAVGEGQIAALSAVSHLARVE